MTGATKAEAIDADAIFRGGFTACPQDIVTLMLDVRQQKHFKRCHIASTTFNVRCSSGGEVLLDYSGAQYNIKWSNDCWWGKRIIVYGDADLKRDHPVIEFLAKQGRCHALQYYKEGFEVFYAKYPFLCGASTSAKAQKKYPSQILPELYLGDWAHAQAADRLAELNIRSVLTIHNHPENLKLSSCIKHMRAEMPDLESADISCHFSSAYDFIEEGRHKDHAVLVHCGAGVSRSATIIIMYLMRRFHWSAEKSRQYVFERRSLISPNEGFWRTLCALEAELGIPARSDPSAMAGSHGADAPEEAQLSEDAAGGKVVVKSLSAKEANELGKRTREDAAGSADEKAAKRGREGVMSGSSGMMVTLEVSKPDGLVEVLEVGPLRYQRVVIGRQPGVDILLQHASVSRQHAAITADPAGNLLLTDLQSQHGTKLDDTWLKPSVAKPLKVGSTMQFGASTRKYRVTSVLQSAR